MPFTSSEATIINKFNADCEKSQLGTEIKAIQDNAPYIYKYAVTADATGGLSVTATEAFEIVDIIVQARATSSSGTVQVLKGSSAISDAIVCAVDTTITRAGTIDDAYSTIAIGDSIKFTTHGANDRGTVTLIGKRS